MKKNFKKLHVVKFIPTIAIKHCCCDEPYLVTSACLYEDLVSAELGLSSLLKMYREHPSYSVLRWSIKRKVFEL